MDEKISLISFEVMGRRKKKKKKKRKKKKKLLWNETRLKKTETCSSIDEKSRTFARRHEGKKYCNIIEREKDGRENFVNPASSTKK